MYMHNVMYSFNLFAADICHVFVNNFLQCIVILKMLIYVVGVKMHQMILIGHWEVGVQLLMEQDLILTIHTEHPMVSSLSFIFLLVILINIILYIQPC